MNKRYFEVDFVRYVTGVSAIALGHSIWHMLLTRNPDSFFSRFMVGYFFEQGLAKPRDGVIEIVIPSVILAFFIFKNGRLVIPFAKPVLVVTYPILVVSLSLIHLVLPHARGFTESQSIHEPIGTVANFIGCCMFSFWELAIGVAMKVCVDNAIRKLVGHQAPLTEEEEEEEEEEEDTKN